MEVATVVSAPFDVSYSEDPVLGESTMLLSMLVPYLPLPAEAMQAASAPVLVAQATTATPKTDMTLSDCKVDPSVKTIFSANLSCVRF
jgi:hypothetical protein